MLISTTADNSGERSGYKRQFYTVEPGDTLIGIANRAISGAQQTNSVSNDTDDTGPGDRGFRASSIASAVLASSSWEDIARWNQISDPTALQVGQALVIDPPEEELRERAFAEPPKDGWHTAPDWCQAQALRSGEVVRLRAGRGGLSRGDVSGQRLVDVGEGTETPEGGLLQARWSHGLGGRRSSQRFVFRWTGESVLRGDDGQLRQQHADSAASATASSTRRALRIGDVVIVQSIQSGMVVSAAGTTEKQQEGKGQVQAQAHLAATVAPHLAGAAEKWVLLRSRSATAAGGNTAARPDNAAGSEVRRWGAKDADMRILLGDPIALCGLREGGAAEALELGAGAQVGAETGSEIANLRQGLNWRPRCWQAEEGWSRISLRPEDKDSIETAFIVEAG